MKIDHTRRKIYHNEATIKTTGQTQNIEKTRINGNHAVQ